MGVLHGIHQIPHGPPSNQLGQTGVTQLALPPPTPSWRPPHFWRCQWSNPQREPPWKPADGDGGDGEILDRHGKPPCFGHVWARKYSFLLIDDIRFPLSKSSKQFVAPISHLLSFYKASSLCSLVIYNQLFKNHSSVHDMHSIIIQS